MPGHPVAGAALRADKVASCADAGEDADVAAVRRDRVPARQLGPAPRFENLQHPLQLPRRAQGAFFFFFFFCDLFYYFVCDRQPPRILKVVQQTGIHWRSVTNAVSGSDPVQPISHGHPLRMHLGGHVPVL